MSNLRNKSTNSPNKILPRPANLKRHHIVTDVSSKLSQVNSHEYPQATDANLDEITVLEDLGSEDENTTSIQLTDDLIDIHDTPLNHTTEHINSIQELTTIQEDEQEGEWDFQWGTLSFIPK